MLATIVFLLLALIVFILVVLILVVLILIVLIVLHNNSPYTNLKYMIIICKNTVFYL